MKGDIIILEEYHKKAAKIIISKIIDKIKNKKTRYIITIAGESGSGKSETGKAMVEQLEKYKIKSILLNQDDYFHLPPRSNDLKRRADPEWLGPHKEVKLDVLEKNIKDAVNGKNKTIKPLVDYNDDSIGKEKINLKGIQVVIAEGTYTSLLKNVDTKIFITRNRQETLAHRKKRNRGNEVNDPFIEQILDTEHKIIAGHVQLADFIINSNYDIITIE